MGGGEGEGDGHHYQHYVARRKIPLAVMVGMYCNRGGPQLWPPGAGGWGAGRERENVHHYQHYVARRKIPLAVMVGCNSDRLLPQPTVV